MRGRFKLPAALLIAGATLAGVSVVWTWAEVGPSPIGHVDVIYRRYRGWELQEGVFVWTVGVVSALCAAAQLIGVTQTSRLHWDRAAFAGGVAALVTACWVFVMIDERVSQDMVKSAFGGRSPQLTEIVEPVHDGNGYVMAAVAGLLMMLGSAWDGAVTRKGPPGEPDGPSSRNDP